MKPTFVKIDQENKFTNLDWSKKMLSQEKVENVPKQIFFIQKRIKVKNEGRNKV